MNELEYEIFKKSRKSGEIKLIIADPEGEYKKLSQMLGTTIVNNSTEELRKRAKKAIKLKKYRKAYKLLRKVKELTLNTIEKR